MTKRNQDAYETVSNVPLAARIEIVIYLFRESVRHALVSIEYHLRAIPGHLVVEKKNAIGSNLGFINVSLSVDFCALIS